MVLPEAEAANERVLVVAEATADGDLGEFLGVAASQNDIVRDQGGLEDAFAAMNKAAAQALIVLTDPVLFSERKPTVDLANRYRLPAVYPFQGYVEDGGLISYGPSDADLFRRAAGYVDRILKGARPAELPVEQPVKFEMYVNLNAAKALGVTVPELFLARADKVIE